MTNPFDSTSVAEQQGAGMAAEIERWVAGELLAPFDAYAAAISIANPTSVIEVGCGCGGYADVTRALCERSSVPNYWIDYSGCDSAEEMIVYAKEHYERGEPEAEFLTGDQLDLPYRDNAADVVVNGCALVCLKTDLEWIQAMREAKRVARKHVLLHRVHVRPRGADSRIVEHQAYGTTLIERQIAGDALDMMIQEVGLRERLRCVWYDGNDPRQETILLDVP